MFHLILDEELSFILWVFNQSEYVLWSCLTVIVVFDAADLDKFLKFTVPLSIWIGILSLGWEIAAAIVK